MPKHLAFLNVHQNQIHNQAGQVVILRGAGLGGWMNMENFITGFSANEDAFRQVVHRALGKEKADFLLDRYIEYFFTEEDASFIRSLGLNLVRLPFNYRHFEDDMNPFVIREAGFKHLDRVIEICAKNQLYTILDLHAAPGYQNQDWHSDNPSMRAFFWQHKHFQDRAVWLWEKIAERYRDNPWVAGYDLLNEPSDPSEAAIGPFYQRIVPAVRKIDPDHIIFLEGNRYSQDFSSFGPPFPNIVYTVHNYATPGFINGGSYPGISRREYFDKSVLRQKMMNTCQYMLENKTPIWVGEFGPVYTGSPADDAWRYQLLQDQLSIYQELGASWSIWTYKDLGLQGIVSLQPDSKWIQKIQPILDKKALLGVDSWGGLDKNVRHIMEPIESTFAEFFPHYQPYPFDAQWQINRTVRHILLAEPLIEDFYPLLYGLDFDEIDALVASFRFNNCQPRERLCQIIKKSGPGSQAVELLDEQDHAK
jgi:aryl-phospho-beta-D-glucosidase BglC (GH1 family)